MERKSADRDAGLEQRQKDQKTLQKTDSEDDSDVVIAQISRSTPLSPSETSIPSNTSALPIAAVDSMGDETSKYSHRPPAAKQTALRVAALLAALTQLALLIVAGNLTPAKQGLGTHQQLGLPPCSMLSLYSASAAPPVG